MLIDEQSNKSEQMQGQLLHVEHAHLFLDLENFLGCLEQAVEPLQQLARPTYLALPPMDDVPDLGRPEKGISGRSMDSDGQQHRSEELAQRVHPL